MCNSFENVKAINTHGVNRNWHTRHGMHFNKFGKQVLADTICNVLSDIKNDVTAPSEVTGTLQDVVRGINCPKN